MSRIYPLDPTDVIAAMDRLNEQIDRLREQGWTVELYGNERFAMHLSISTFHFKPPQEGQ